MVLYNRKNPDNKAIGFIIISDLKAKLNTFIVASIILKILSVKRFIREIYRLIKN